MDALGPTDPGTSQAQSPAATWGPSAALVAGAVLMLGPAFQLASHIIEPTLATTSDRLRWVAENEAAATTAKSLDLLALPFLFGMAFVWVLLSRQRSPRLAHAGGVLLAVGLIGLAAVEGFETLAFIQVADGRFDLTSLADVAENHMGSGPGIVMMLMFLVPALLGILALSAALWASKAVPRLSVILIVFSFLLDVVLVEGAGVPHWLPHAVSLAANALIAAAVLRAARVALT